MVVQNKSILPRTIAQGSPGRHARGLLSQEAQCMAQAYTLDPINLKEIRPSAVSVVLYCALLSLEVAFAASVGALATKQTYLGLLPLTILFLILVLCNFANALIYRKILGRAEDLPFLAYVYACMYSIVYLPVPVFVQYFLEPIGLIFVFAVTMVSQYYVSVCLLKDYQFSSSKQQFLFWVACFVLQYITLYAADIYVRQSTSTG